MAFKMWKKRMLSYRTWLFLSLVYLSIAASGQNRSSNADARVDIIRPSSALQLAQGNELIVHVTSGSELKIGYIQQWYKTPDGFASVNGSEQELKFLKRGNGETYINVTPLRLGEIELRIVGLFADDGLFHESIPAYVKPPLKPPVKFWVNQVPLVAISLTDHICCWLTNFATYDGIKQPIEIDPQFVRFNVKATPDHEVVSIDAATGRVKPVQPGHALVEMSYQGLTTRVCIVVKGNIGDGYDCSELLVPGEKFP